MKDTPNLDHFMRGYWIDPMLEVYQTIDNAALEFLHNESYSKSKGLRSEIVDLMNKNMFLDSYDHDNDPLKHKDYFLMLNLRDAIIVANVLATCRN